MSETDSTEGSDDDAIYLAALFLGNVRRENPVTRKKRQIVQAYGGAVEPSQEERDRVRKALEDRPPRVIGE